MSKEQLVGQSVAHDSAYSHVTGESVFIDDRPPYAHELFVGIVGSPVAHGVLKKIHAEKALALEGVELVLTAEDLVHNRWGTIVQDQPLLVAVNEEILYASEPLCLVAARSAPLLDEAKKLITFEIEQRAAVFEIDEAIKRQMFLYQAHPFRRGEGDIDEVLTKCPHQLSGAVEIGGQEHFYMESQAAVVYPLENGCLEVHASSQHPTETQHVVAHATGLSFHQVTTIVKRMGGGFGGKESQAAPIAAYAALVAQKSGKPARLILSKDDDMKITGKRHPFKNYYQVGFDDQGKILAFKVHLYADAGAYVDLSPSILERAMFHVDGAYYLPNVLIEATCCQTHHHSNTAFRGFGGPQGNMTMESIMEDIAFYLGQDALSIRQRNAYQVDHNNITPYGQKVENNLMPKLFNLIEKKANYRERLAALQQFNHSLDNKKKGLIKGISVTATKFGIAFTAKFLNQGNALVNLHTDGSVQVSTGATEMGQGVNTKIAQIVAHTLGLPMEKVLVMATSTEKNHNTSPTAASSGTDINGAAAYRAALRIKNRLKLVAEFLFQGKKRDDQQDFDLSPLPPRHPEDDITLEENFYSHLLFTHETIIHTPSKEVLPLKTVITEAYLQRISLGEYAHFKTPGIGFDKQKVQGKAFNYFTQGVACSEVLIDTYTGEMKVLATDILMDLGRPINPSLDYGQVTGAFIQGMGWVTTEKLYYHSSGELISHSPTTYKIPNIQDTPRHFQVELIPNPDLKVNIFGSKAVGEPPLLLGTSVWTAVKMALYAQADSYQTLPATPLKSPATNEEILLYLEKIKKETIKKKK